MRTLVSQTPAVRAAIIAMGVVAVILAMRAIAAILAPFLLAILVAVFFQTLLNWFQRRNLPNWAAMTLTCLSLLVLGIGLYLIVNSAVSDLSAAVPKLEEDLAAQITEVSKMLASFGIDANRLLQKLQQVTADPTPILGYFVQGLGALLSSALMVLLYALFMVFEAGAIRGKIRVAFGDQSSEAAQLGGIVASLRSYLVVQTVLSAMVGLAVGAALFLLRIEFSALWGVLAFLLNFVPNFGPVLAAIPAVIMAFIQYGPSARVLMVIAAYAVIVFVVGSLVYPRIMGKSVGLSPLAVLVALVLWGWVLGPLGLILSVPILATIKIVLEAYPPTRWAAILLGNRSEPSSS